MANAIVLGLGELCRVVRAVYGASVSVVTLGAMLVAVGCSSAEPSPIKRAQSPDFTPVSCGEDQVREFYCEGLLPMSTALGAPPPYENCPAGLEVPQGSVHATRQRVARFDAAHTEWKRQRAKPGHACCYSWCGEVDIRDSEDVPENAGCSQPGVIRESYCMPELESGTSNPAEAPFESCPVAIRPPEVLHFYVPKAAPLDLTLTQDRRGRGLTECCYGWCSRMPAGVLPEKKSTAE